MSVSRRRGEGGSRAALIGSSEWRSRGVSGDGVRRAICVATMRDNVRALLAQQTPVSSCKIRVWTSCQVWFVRHASAVRGRVSKGGCGWATAWVAFGSGRRASTRGAGDEHAAVVEVGRQTELERAVLAAGGAKLAVSTLAGRRRVVPISDQTRVAVEQQRCSPGMKSDTREGDGPIV
jgi:hypothetical protein